MRKKLAALLAQILLDQLRANLLLRCTVVGGTVGGHVERSRRDIRAGVEEDRSIKLSLGASVIE